MIRDRSDRCQLQGSIVALVTPMKDDGTLDFETFKRLIDWHIAESTDAIVVVGTTGESPTVNMEEHGSLVRVAVEHAAGRIPIIAGTGGNSTSEAIELTTYAQRVGAAASLQVVPYYNKPTQEGMFQHFKAVAAAVDLPLILYNVPGRTVADMSNETVLRLAQLPNVIGIKDATGDLARGARLLRDVPEGFAVYSGDDATALPFMLLGAAGNISVTANVVPRAMAELCRLARAGQVADAVAVNRPLMGLHQHLFCQANPIPVKWALQQMERIGAGIRLPMTVLEDGYHALVREAMLAAGVMQ